jgi:hypothetical protein
MSFRLQETLCWIHREWGVGMCYMLFTVRYHCGGWFEEVNSCILIISYMVYLFDTTWFALRPLFAPVFLYFPPCLFLLNLDSTRLPGHRYLPMIVCMNSLHDFCPLFLSSVELPPVSLIQVQVVFQHIYICIYIYT